MGNRTAKAHPFGTERRKNRWRSLAGAVLCAVLLCTNAAGALALTPESESAGYPGERRKFDNGQEQDKALAEHTVKGIQPPGTTLNLFDYVASKDGATEKDLTEKVRFGDIVTSWGTGSNVAIPTEWNKGINQNRLLIFGDSIVGAGYWNIGGGAGRAWARDYTNMQGIVENTLSADYPRINKDAMEDPLSIVVPNDGSSYSEPDLPFALQYADYSDTNRAPIDQSTATALSSEMIKGINDGSIDTSLDYLFDPAVQLEGDIKRSHEDVKGLFQVDDEGYYYYDARQNFAEFDEKNNTFILYDGPAVWRTDGAWDGSGFSGDRTIGNFFPFNTGKQVFDCLDEKNRLTSSTDIDNGKWSGAANGLTNKATGDSFFVNHHMGMSMTIDFAQPENGTIKMGKAGEKDMVFQFSGDDDVWVFIDDVLVLDLGGIHSELYGTIDFATGEVITGQGWRYASGMPEKPGEDDEDGSYRTATLYELFYNALGADDPKVANGWTQTEKSGKNQVFATGTSHTLKLFYLERGNYDSSLHMKFNLQPPLYHSIKKVDQDGGALEGVRFELYPAEKKDNGALKPVMGTEAADDFEITGELIGTLATGEDGMATFVRTDGSPFSFSDWAHRNGGHTLFILKESTPPQGYRPLPNDIVLSFNPDTSMLTVLNRYQTGAYASFVSYIKELSGVTYGAFQDGDILASGTELNESSERNGLVIAVPMLLQKKLSSGGTGDGTWVALYGSNGTSYQAIVPQARTAVEWRKAVLKAALYQASDTAWPEWRLTYNDEGYLEGTLTDLPGRADRYALVNETDADMKMVYGVIEPAALERLGITEGSSAKRYDALEAYVSDALKKGEDAGKTADAVMDEICEAIGFADGDFADRGFSFLNTDQFQRDFRSMIYIPNERRELRLWKVDEDGRGVNGAEFTLYKEDGTEAAFGVTANVDGRDGVLIFRPEPPKKGDGTDDADGYARTTWDDLGEYYIEETRAPAGYTRNATRIPVVVGHYSVYADAGSKADGVSVMAGVGKLMQTMSRYAADNAVNITLRDITAFAQSQPSAGFDLNGWQDVLLENTGNALRSMNLHYGRNAVVQYGLHDEDGGANIYPFFTTDEGYLRTRVEQNTAALQDDSMYAGAVNSANYDDLEGVDLTSLFSQINIVVVTDAKDTPDDAGRLSIRKRVEGPGLNDSDYTRNFTFEVALRDDGGNALSGAYYYYGEQRAGYIRDGGTLSLRHDEALTVLGLPVGTRWTVTERPAGDGWKMVPDSGSISGEVLKDETAYATFTNHKSLLLGDLTVTKNVTGDGGDLQKDFRFTVTLSDATLSGQFGNMIFANGAASFTLKHGESKTASGLPEGIRYKVTEAGEAGYTAACEKAEGTIDSGTGAVAAFVNTYVKPTPTPADTPRPTPRPTPDVPKTDLTITKVWNDEGYDGRPDAFTVIVRANDDPTFWHKRVIKRDEPSTVVSQDGSRWTFKAQWNDHDYRIEEVDVPGYVSSVVKDGNRFTITNTYMPKTGDQRPILRDILLAACGLALLAAAWRLLHAKKPQKRR